MTPKMRGTTTGLKQNLESTDAQMYRLYQALEHKYRENLIPSPLEIMVAKGEKPVSALGCSLDADFEEKQPSGKVEVSFAINLRGLYLSGSRSRLIKQLWINTLRSGWL